MGIMIQTAILVTAILAVRKLFGERLHAYIRYGLWMLVALRLAVPVNLIDSPFSLLRVTDMAMMRYQEAAFTAAPSGSRFGAAGSASAGGGLDDHTDHMTAENLLADGTGSMPARNQKTEGKDSTASIDGQQVDKNQNMPVNKRAADDDNSVLTDNAVADGGRISERLPGIFRIIWVLGSLAVGCFLLIANYHFRIRLYRMRQPVWEERSDKLPIYQVEGLESACLAGFFRPTIYIGSDIKPESDYFRYIVIHEKVHYLHGDHIWALLRVMLAAVYWFHPFVWIAAAASVRDGEIACDHGTIQRLGEKERMPYGTMLLDLTRAGGKKRLYSYGTMLRPGRSEIKERILRLAGGKGDRMWAGFLVILLMLAVAGCAFTGAAEGNRNRTGGTDGAAGVEAVLTDNKENMTVNEGTDPDNTVRRDIDDMDDTDDTGGSSTNGDLSQNERLWPFDPEENISGQRQLTAVSAALSEETLFGADGPTLDYAGKLGTGEENIIIFHDYFGLVVYDLTNGKVLQSLDLARIDCHMTQGDNVCQIRVAADGTTVWLHPKTRQYMFRYEVVGDLLCQVPLVKTFDIDLEAEDLFDRYLVTEENEEGWHSNYLYEEYKDEKGLQTAYIYLFVSGKDEQRFGSLQCVWDDMVYLLCDQDGAWMEEARDVGKEVRLSVIAKTLVR